MPSASAQQQQKQQAQMADGMLRISAGMPETIRASEQFTYQVTVTNTTDNVVLHDIRLRQSKAKGFSIESVSTGGKQSQGKQKQGKQNDGNQNQGSQNQANRSQANQQSGNQQSGNQKRTMKIAKLEPGQSKTVRVTAAADQEGKLNTCLQIASYKPSLCLTSEVVKPELQLTKVAPEEANRCEVIELTYGVKNSGSGKIDKFQIRDQLAEGLRTVEGQKQLEFTVDGGLDAGEVREFVANVYATQTGEFSSRAVAQASQSDLKARSKKVATRVVAADLKVNVSGGGTVYGNQPATFIARVTNSGNAPAENVDVQLAWPQEAQLVQVSDPQRAQARSGGNGQSNQQQGQPTPANNQNQRQGNNQNQGNNQQPEMNTRSLAIDGLKPGEAVEFRYVIRPNGAKEIPTRVRATYVCELSGVEDQAQARTKITSTGNAVANVLRVPALQVYAVDASDPVASGEQVAYTIRVRNEGDAADNQIELTAQLPEGFEFQNADGPTEPQSTGSTVSFKPIEKLEPGDQVEYTVTAKSQGEGDVELQVKLESDALQQAVSVAEPTRIYRAQTRN